MDSSYVTYLAKEKLGLRPLLLHVDAGWNSQQAVNNIEKLVDGLGLDLHTEVVDWREMRDLQLAFFKAAGAAPRYAAGSRLFRRALQLRREARRQVHPDRRQLFDRMRARAARVALPRVRSAAAQRYPPPLRDEAAEDISAGQHLHLQAVLSLS